MSERKRSEAKAKWLCSAKWLPAPIHSWLCRSHDASSVKMVDEPESVPEATGAIIAHILSRPDSIRQRAQNAATISGALAVALVVAAVTGLADEGASFKPWTSWLVYGAIVAFGISTLLSVYAVVFPHPSSGDKNYTELVKQYEDYADEVRQKMRWAATATVVAVVLTAGAVIAEVDQRTSADVESMNVVLTPEAMSAVEELCEWGRTMTRQIKGHLRKDELAKDVVEIENVSYTPDKDGKPPAGSACSTCTGTVRLSRRSIRAAKDASRSGAVPRFAP